MLIVLTIVILSYLVGSIPFSILISKQVRGIDIRDYGSGNAGATNVVRVLGWKLGLLTIVLDSLKGVAAVLLISRLFFFTDFNFYNFAPFDNYFSNFTVIQIIAGMSAIVGHIWSVFANFRGGKGIATALGMMISLVTIDLLIGLSVFILVVALSRYVSLGSLIGATMVPVAMIIRENLLGAHISSYHTLLPFIFIILALVYATHRKNIVRLIKGKENKISFSKNKSTDK